MSARESFYLDEKDTVKAISLVTYLPLAHVEQFCLEWCQHYAFIHHDNDITEDGKPKEPHTHVLCTFKDRTQVSAIVRRLTYGATDNTTVTYKKVLNRNTAFAYLDHSNAPHKYQYPHDYITTDDEKFFTSSNSELRANENEQFIEDLRTASNLDMARKYGRDFMKNYRSYDFFRNVLRGDEETARRQELIEKLLDDNAIEIPLIGDDAIILENYVERCVIRYLDSNVDVTEEGINEAKRQALLTAKRLKDNAITLDYLRIKSWNSN